MQYSIFQNDFYEERPGVPWAYRVSITAFDLVYPIKLFTYAVKEVILPEVELMTFKVHYLGRSFDIPTRYRNSSTFTMKFSERNDLAAYSWIQRLYERTYNGLRSDLSTDLRIRVEILDPSTINSKDTSLDFTTSKRKEGNTKTEENEDFSLKGNDAEVVEIYDFSGCFIDKIDDLELDYSSEEILEWSLTVQFNEMKVTYPKHAKTNLPEEQDNIETVDVPKKGSRDIDFTTANQIRDEDWLMRIGANGYGGPGGGGKGAGNWNGQEKPGEYGLSETGEKEARNLYGNSPDGNDAHNDNSAKEKSNASKKKEPEVKLNPLERAEFVEQTGLDYDSADNETKKKWKEANEERKRQIRERLEMEEKADAFANENFNGNRAEVARNVFILIKTPDIEDETVERIIRKNANAELALQEIAVGFLPVKQFDITQEERAAYIKRANELLEKIKQNKVKATEEANK